MTKLNDGDSNDDLKYNRFKEVLLS